MPASDCAASAASTSRSAAAARPVNKLSENGTFISTETKYCRMTKMRATDLVLDLMELMGSRVGELAETDIRNLGAVPRAAEAVTATPVV